MEINIKRSTNESSDLVNNKTNSFGKDREPEMIVTQVLDLEIVSKTSQITLKGKSHRFLIKMKKISPERGKHNELIFLSDRSIMNSMAKRILNGGFQNVREGQERIHEQSQKQRTTTTGKKAGVRENQKKSSVWEGKDGREIKPEKGGGKQKQLVLHLEEQETWS